MPHANTIPISLIGILSLAAGCSKPAAVVPVHEPTEAEPAPSAESATDPDVEPETPDWRCTQTDIEPLRLAIERSCDIRPEFRDDCLGFYGALPVWSFEPSRADDAAYCTLHRPDSTSLILEHVARDPEAGACARYSVTFVPHDQGWELDSAELDKTCD